MTITWKQELNLLNDEQLGRIAYADENSWGRYYNEDEFGRCCIIAKINNCDQDLIKEYQLQLIGVRDSTPLEEFYYDSYLTGRCSLSNHDFIISNPEIIEEIQNEAKLILEARKQRVVEEQEIVTT